MNLLAKLDPPVPTVDRYAKGWPKFGDQAGPALYAPLSVVLSGEFPDDRHFAAYSLPAVPYRLAGVEALEHGGVPVVLFVVDVDAGGHAPDEAWRAEQATRITRLLNAHPGGFVYTTRGGYRVVYRLPEPFWLRSPIDAEHWKLVYASWLAQVEFLAGIQGDPACKDWTRLYRLPRVLREGVVQNPQTWGNPTTIGVWNPQIELPARPDTMPAVGPAIEATGAADPGLLATVLQRVAELGPAVKGASQTSKTYQAACIARHDYALSEEESLWVLNAWDRVNVPPRGPDNLKAKIRDAERYAQGRRGEARELYELKRSGDFLGAPKVDGPAVDEEPSERRSALLSEIATVEKPPVRRYKTGINALDALIGGGVTTRQLAVVAAPPGAGKSALMVTVGMHLERTVPVLYASTELERDEVAARHAAPEIGCCWKDIVDGSVSMKRALAVFAERRIRVIGAEDFSGDYLKDLGNLTHEIELMTREHRIPPVVILDYMQDLARGTDDKGMRTKVGNIATDLRRISQKRDLAMLGISSVSRSHYGQAKAEALRASEDPTVYLSAAKESGDVDYAAAVIIFLDVDTAKADGRPARIAVAKSRHGMTGFVGARFHGASGKWVEDSAAVKEMTVESREDKRHKSSVDDAKERILRTLREQPMTREGLAVAVKMDNNKRTAIVKQLIQERVIQEFPEFNAKAGQHVKVLRVVEDV